MATEELWTAFMHTPRGHRTWKMNRDVDYIVTDEGRYHIYARVKSTKKAFYALEEAGPDLRMLVELTRNGESFEYVKE